MNFNFILVAVLSFALFSVGIVPTQSIRSDPATKSQLKNLEKPIPPLAEHLAEGHKDQQTLDHAAFDLEAAHAAGELDETYDEDIFADEWNDEYFTDGFNITARLQEMFPVIDANHDGFISLAEMEKWHYDTGMNTSKLRAEREFTATDENEDGSVSLKEYLGEDFKFVDKTDDNTQNNQGDEHDGNLAWVKSVAESFGLADEDKDELLSRDEFFNFLHPEESGREDMYAHLLKETLRERDQNGDMKLTMEEFEENLWHELKPYDEESRGIFTHDYEDPSYYEHHEEDPAKIQADHEAAKNKFSALDKNQDGFLEHDELRPEMMVLHPGEKDFARKQAEHVVEQADDNKDGSLTLQEMIDNPYTFYSAAVGHDDSYYYHDEFR